MSTYCMLRVKKADVVGDLVGNQSIVVVGIGGDTRQHSEESPIKEKL